MIEFKKIENSSDSLFSKMYELYQSAFPAVERRDLNSLVYVLNNDKNFEIDALMKDNDFVGFFSYWLFKQFVYIEHFVIDSKMQGQRIGTKVVEIFLSKINLPVVLEIEIPEDTQSTRRIKFYERLGFKVFSHSYAQPYYDGSEKSQPMLLMSNKINFAEEHFDLIKDTLYKKVYRYFQKTN